MRFLPSFLLVSPDVSNATMISWPYPYPCLLRVYPVGGEDHWSHPHATIAQELYHSSLSGAVHSQHGSVCTMVRTERRIQ